MHQIVSIWVLVFLSLGSVNAQSQDDRRVALLIGNSDYTNVPALANPVNDATDLGAALDRLGFEVTIATNNDLESFQGTLDSFVSSTQDAKLSIIYYAGHGIEVDGENYLIPITARLESGADVATQTVPLTSVLQMIANTGGVKVVLVDACRNNPFAERLRSQPGSRRIGTGLSRVDVMRQGEKPGGIMIGYAAREGTFALDGEGRRNSPYAEALLKHIEEPSLEIGKLFRNVRDTVFSLTDGYQEPFTYGSLPGEDIYLAAAVAPPPLLAADSDEDTLFEAASNVGTPDKTLQRGIG